MLDDSFRVRYKSVPIAISNQNDFSPTGIHNHNEFEILLIKSGSCTVCVAGEEYTAKQGDMFFINPMEVHEIAVNDTAPYEHKCMCFDTSLIMNNRISETLKNECTNIVHKVNGEPYLSDLFEKIFDEVKAGGKTYAMDVTAYITLMFSYLLKNSMVDEKISPKENTFCQNVLSFINEHYCEKITSRQAAEACFLNHSYFCRKFKEDFGKSFSAYLNTHRVSVARTMLEESGETVTAISEMCGFETPAYFSKCFKEYTGILPLEYKKGKRSL